MITMRGTFIRRKITKLFESRKGHLDYRIKRDFVREGIATIPCQISEYYDVICSYSVKGCESLNPEFEDYVKVITDMTPPDCPVVLNIICNNLSQDEKDIIEDTILDDFAYNLGLVEKEEKRHTQSFALMTIGLIISGILLWISNAMAEVPRELLYILFWFLGENLCDYIFLSGYDLREERRLSGRLASVKVFFSENYEEPHYTKNDVDVLFSEIEKDINETIQNSEEH